VIPSSRALALIGACSLFLAGCASSGTSASGSPTRSAGSTSPSAPPSPSPSSPPDCLSLGDLIPPLEDRGTETVSGSSIEIEASDTFMPGPHLAWFEPTCVVAKAGTTLNVTVKNTGTALHNFSIDRIKLDEDIPIGKSIHVRVKVPRDPVTFFCRYHPLAGMQGAFVPG
jgi:plastocyanin